MSDHEEDALCLLRYQEKIAICPTTYTMFYLTLYLEMIHTSFIYVESKPLSLLIVSV